MQIAHPEFLLLLLVLPVLYLVWRQQHLGGVRAYTSLAVRVAMTLALVLALAGLTVAQPLDRQAVVFVANRSVAPTANPVGGFLMYAESGAAKVRGSSGTVTTFGPADPHCPACGADFGSEHYNPRYGYVSVCLFCLAADLGDKPYIVRHQATEHAEEVAVRTEAEVTAAREERLESALELLRSCEAPAANPTTEGSVE